MIDPALMIDAGLSHSGACLYAALAFLWFEHVTDAAKLHDLERRAGRKRLDPVVVTADELFAFTGLKKDGIAARVRELEAPHPCIWRGCEDGHPLVTVRRLGQGRGLRIGRFICGSEQPRARRRVAVASGSGARPRASKDSKAGAISGSPIPESIKAENPLPTRFEIEHRGDEPLDPAGKHAAATPSQKELVPYAENAPTPGSETRGYQSLERGTDAFWKAAAPRFLIRDIKTRRTIKTAAGARAEPVGSNAAAALEESTVTSADTTVTDELAESILRLARKSEPGYAATSARRVACRLLTAAVEAGLTPEAACDRLQAAVVDPRVTCADKPIAFLIRGVIGDRTNAAFDRFLLTDSLHAAHGPNPKFSLGGASSRLSPALQECLLERMRSGQPIDARWLRERDIPRAAVDEARKRADENKVQPSASTLCDALELSDPVEYRKRLEQILASVSVPHLPGMPARLDHPMFLGLCRNRLEHQLSHESGSSLNAQSNLE